MDLNNSHFSGRLTSAARDISHQYVDKNNVNNILDKCIFNLAVNSDRKDESGNYIPVYVPFVAIGKKSELIKKCYKGDSLIITAKYSPYIPTELKNGENKVQNNFNVVTPMFEVKEFVYGPKGKEYKQLVAEGKIQGYNQQLDGGTSASSSQKTLDEVYPANDNDIDDIFGAISNSSNSQEIL